MSEKPWGGVQALNRRSCLPNPGGVAAFIADLKSDIRQAEEQAKNGPFYPEKGITRESCLAYAEDCREKLKDPRNELVKILLKFV